MYVRGVVNDLADPKVILFFLAFLPQFVDGTLDHVGLQLVVLGLIFLVRGLCLDVILGAMAGRVGLLLRRHPRTARLAGRLAGVTFAALAAQPVLLREPA